MFRVLWGVSNEHDPRLIALAALVCALASITSLKLLQRGLSSSEISRRGAWIIVAGVVTGVGIWATHFTAMLAYHPGLPVGFDPMMAVTSVIAAIGLCIVGWYVAFARPVAQPVAGAAIVGAGIVVAHYLDVRAMTVAGRITYHYDLVAASVVVGIGFSALAGWLLSRRLQNKLPLAPSAALGAGILGLHFVGMAAITIIPDPSIVVGGTALELHDLGGLVITAICAILSVGLALGLYDQRLERLAAIDNKRLADALAALQQSQEHYRFSVALNPQISWICDSTGHLLEIGPKWYELTGMLVETTLGMGWTEAVHEADRPAAWAAWEEAVRTGAPYDVRYRLRTSDGSDLWMRDRAAPRRGPDGAILLWYGALEDIDEQAKAEAALRRSEERYRLASRATNDIILDWQRDIDRVCWGDAVETLGYPEAKDGTSQAWWLERIHPDERERVRVEVMTALQSDAEFSTSEYRFRKADGTYADILSRGYISRDEDGAANRIVGALLDVTERKRALANLRWTADHDTLTGIPNRALFNRRLATALEEAAAEGKQVGLILLDVDHFKTVNDTRGHAAGDHLLKTIASRLASTVTAPCSVARLGGDEFAIILPGLECGMTVDAIRTLLHGFDSPTTFDNRAINCGASVGAAFWPGDGETPETLLKAGDLALYAAKSAGGDTVKTFSPAMLVSFDTRALMVLRARTALDDDQIVPFYQPKIDLRTGRLAGFEALLRWHDPARGLQAPAEIEAAFEDMDLAARLTDRMIERVIRDVRTWRENGVRPGKIAVNGSMGDFLRGDFADRFLQALRAANIAPSCFELEVIETVFIGRAAEAVETTLNVLHDAGMTIALDDFGTGYASLSHLKQFPVDVLKIDRSFVSKLTADDDDHSAIVGAVVGLGHSLGITTVGEGVETAAQAGRLIAMGCDIGQGFLFSRAVEAARVPDLVATAPLRWRTLMGRTRVAPGKQDVAQMPTKALL